MESFIYPLHQSIGAPSVPVVEVGTEVRRGEMLAAAPEGKLGCPIHASVTGRVAAVTADAITVEAEDVPVSMTDVPFEKLAPAAPLDMVRASGLVGLGGAGFPAAVKYAKPLGPSGTVIMNAAECEPILSHNIDALEQHPEAALRGLAIAMDLAGTPHGVIAIKGIHTKAIAALEHALSSSLPGMTGKDIRLHKLKNIYPVGEERAIVREVLGTLLDVTDLPSAAGAIVSNIETLTRMHEAVDLGKPLMDKDLTVAGKLEKHMGETLIYHDVPIGRMISSMLDIAGGTMAADSYGELLMGGPFTGHRTTSGAPIVKTTGGIIVTECFPKAPPKIGLLVCACSAAEARMREVAASLGSTVVGIEYCKQALPVKAARKCKNPGICPGQVAKILALKKAGAQAVLIGNCTDCTNTVMTCAPALGLPVYHVTDQALRSVNQKLIRKIHTPSQLR